LASIASILPLAANLASFFTPQLERYICVNYTIIVCDVQLYEREDVSRLPYILRMALLDEALSGSAPENVHMRLHFRLKETRRLI
jgi:hypothetical protein